MLPSKQNAGKWRRAVLCIALSAAAYYFSTGLGTFWPAAWIAPAPVLVIAAGRTKWQAALAACGAYFIGSLNVFTYLTMVMPVPLVLLALLGPAVVFAGAVLIFRRAVWRLSPWAAAFVFPATWVSYEFVASRISPHGTASSLAYTQIDALPVVQIASVCGLWGITFLVTLVPAAIAVAWIRKSYFALLPAAVLTSAALAAGVFRLNEKPRQPLVRVGLAATDAGVAASYNTEDESRALAVARGYAERIARLARQGAQVVILPEKLVGVTPAYADTVLNVFSQAARDGGVTVIAGLNRIGIPARRNVAVVIGPDGKMIAEYDKRHFLPGPESGYKAGTERVVFAAPGGKWGVAICKDMDFPPWLRGYGQRKAALLAVPAWDFVLDAHLHSRMAMLRGVENGFTIARAAQEGALTFSDAYGRVLAEQTSSTAPDSLLVRDIPQGPGATFYTRYGDWFAWVNVVMLLSLLAWTAARSARLPSDG